MPIENLHILGIWTVTHLPLDMPGTQYAARLHHVLAGETRPTDEVVTGATLEEVRDALPPGLICIARSPGDDPVIVESWL